MHLVLFDIDGTLLRTRGAGREAMDRAFAALHGWEKATHTVDMAGNTDSNILRQVEARFGHPGVDVAALQSEYLRSYRALLADEPTRLEVCPGVPRALEALRGRAHVALLTGNWECGAREKLGGAGLWDAFEWGAYADDHVDRNALVPIARARAEARGLTFDRVIVIGDTPADIACARAGDALAVAVETGFSTPEALAACRPDLQLRDLDQGLGWLLALIGQAERR